MKLKVFVLQVITDVVQGLGVRLGNGLEILFEQVFR